MQRVVVRELAEQGIDYRTLGREDLCGACGNGRKRAVDRSRDRCSRSAKAATGRGRSSRCRRSFRAWWRMVFVQLYDEGLIYRAHYMTNWCPCRSSCSTSRSLSTVKHTGHQFVM